MIANESEVARMCASFPWHYEYDTHGGYDSMSDGFVIFNGHGTRISAVDCGDFPRSAAEEIARMICDAANSGKLHII